MRSRSVEISLLRTFISEVFDAHDRTCWLFYSSCLSSVGTPALPPLLPSTLYSSSRSRNPSFVPTTVTTIVAVTVRWTKIRRFQIHCPSTLSSSRDNETRQSWYPIDHLIVSRDGGFFICEIPREVAESSHNPFATLARTMGVATWKRGDLVSEKRDDDSSAKIIA